jgi:S1-C subfamily serine protease
MMMTSVEGTVCRDCGSLVAVRLLAGESCPQCESSKAWERYGRRGEKLVIAPADIAEAEARLGAGDVRAIASLKYWLAGVAALAIAVGAIYCVRDLLAARPVGPLAPLFAEMQATSLWSTGLGFLALAFGAVSTLAQKKGRLFRSASLLVVNLTAVIAGAATMLVGVVHWGGMSGVGWAHMAMPPLEAASPTLSAHERSIMSATTVLMAPDGTGNARGVSLGSGAVIRSERGAAFVVTCSHVAMPYASVAAFRDPKDAYPVWVYFSDGRHAEGRVVWTAEPPLDVALVRVAIEDPPQPVPVRASADAAEAGFDVSFVPNPFRSGWTVHRGKVLKREPHRTPAGEFSLIYTSLPVQPGDSGTGLFDSLGRLVGLNAWTQFEEGGPKGISLPSNTMERIVEMMDGNELTSLERGGEP